MQPHEDPTLPHKLGALEFYADGLLSTRGAATLERHLACCAACREALATIRRYRALQRDVMQIDREPAPLDDAAFARIEAAIAPVVRELAAAHRDASPREVERPVERKQTAHDVADHVVERPGAAASAATSPSPVVSLDTARAKRAAADSMRPSSPSLVPPIRSLRRTFVVGGGLALAAVALLAVWSSTREEELARHDEPTVTAPTEQPREVEPVAASVSIELLASSGSLTLTHEHDTADELLGTAAAWLAAGAPRELVSGDVLRIAGAGELRVRVVDDETSTELALVRAIDGAPSLLRATEDGIDLVPGGAMAARGFAHGLRTVVLAHSERVEAVTARFDITFEPIDGAVGEPSAAGEIREAEVRELTVHEGEALVFRDGVATPSVPAADATDAEPIALAPVTGDSAVLRANHPSLVRWDIDGHTLSGAGELAVRLPLGTHVLTGFDARGREFRHRITLSPEGSALGVEAFEPVRGDGFLDPDVIRGVVEASLPTMRRCYEHAMRARSDLEGGQFTARVTVDPRGRVRSVQLSRGAPEALRECVTTTANAWSFPAPAGNGPVSFDLPLTFRGVR